MNQSFQSAPVFGKNAIYAQAGGATAMLNTSAAGVIQAWQQHAPVDAILYAAHEGILGALAERLFDVTQLPEDKLLGLTQSPAAAFGTCRHVLQGDEGQRLIEVLRAYDIGYFFYNGGGGAARACHDVLAATVQFSYPLNCIHIPKTIDNDLPATDCSIGFGSAAKYLATSLREASMDLASVASSSSKVFILETMGRYSGWLTLACGLAFQHHPKQAYLLLLPEQAFDETSFLLKVQQTITAHGYCVIAVAEGVVDQQGHTLHASGQKDAAGDRQLGGVAPMLAELISRQLGHKCHWSVADYLQRSARHLASMVDSEQALATGQAAVTLALQGQINFSPIIQRLADSPYQWRIQPVPLADVAAPERRVPREFLTVDGWQLSEAGRAYLLPLIQGQAPVVFEEGLPLYPQLNLPLLMKKLAEFDVVI
jgi:ATP-dependent phosphofructokinase / diphosphate-dependent phosphofructokinase